LNGKIRITRTVSEFVFICGPYFFVLELKENKQEASLIFSFSYLEGEFYMSIVTGRIKGKKIKKINGGIIVE